MLRYILVLLVDMLLAIIDFIHVRRRAWGSKDKRPTLEGHIVAPHSFIYDDEVDLAERAALHESAIEPFGTHIQLRS